MIKDYKKDDIINDIFVVKFKKPVEKYKNGYRFELRLGDASKEIMLKFWGPDDEQEVQELYKKIKNDNFIRTQARVVEWNNKLELSVNDIINIQFPNENEINKENFIAKSKRDIEGMFMEFMTYLESIENKEIKKLMESFFKDPKFAEAFKKAPAAMYMHHGWIGGLLEHSLAVMSIATDALKIHNNLNRDLVIAGSALHDFGKLEEFAVTSNIKVSTEGMLIGHIASGFEKLSKRLEELNISNTLKLKLKHMILAHHGEKENGSPKTPSFPEALLVSLADDLDWKVQRMQMLKEEANTEDDYIYDRDFGNIYLK